MIFRDSISIGKKMAAVNLPFPAKYKESHTFAIFVPVLTESCTLNLKVIWLYQCKLATVTSYKADVSNVSPSSEGLTLQAKGELFCTFL